MDKESQYTEVLKRIADLNKENDLPYVDLDMLTPLVGTLDKEYVHEYSDELTIKHFPLVVSYGLDNFRDLYDIASSNQIEKSSKDFSSLQLTEREVVRNGKPMKTRIYESINSGTDNKIKPSRPKDSKVNEDSEIVLAKSLNPVIVNVEEEPLSKEQVKVLRSVVQSLDIIEQGVLEKEYIKLLVNEYGETKAVLGIAVDGGLATLGLYATDYTVRQLNIRRIFELIRFSLSKGIDAFVKEEQISTYQEKDMLEFYGFVYDEGQSVYIAMHDELEAVFGEWRTD